MINIEKIIILLLPNHLLFMVCYHLKLTLKAKMYGTFLRVRIGLSFDKKVSLVWVDAQEHSKGME